MEIIKIVINNIKHIKYNKKIINKHNIMFRNSFTLNNNKTCNKYQYV